MPSTPSTYLNGSFVPRTSATLSVEERGTLFGDGVYEVVRYYGGQAFAADAHLQRLRRSLAGIQLAEPPALADLPAISDELIRRDGLRDATVYWQVSRGPAPRAHLFPAGVQPTVLAMAYPAAPLPPDAADAAPPQWKAVLAEDMRWSQCWIKSLMLLPNVLAKNQAKEAGAHEAILHRDGTVTEGTSSNTLIVRHGILQTHPANRWILGGITREIVLTLARQEGLDIEERPFTVDELRSADEILLCGTTTHVAAVTHLDGAPVGPTPGAAPGAAPAPGPITTRLHRAFIRHVCETCRLSGDKVTR